MSEFERRSGLPAGGLIQEEIYNLQEKMFNCAVEGGKWGALVIV